jgi:hypothetical protein
VSEWDWYIVAAKLINITFQYLNQHWIPAEIEKGSKDVYFVNDVC